MLSALARGHSHWGLQDPVDTSWETREQDSCGTCQTSLLCLEPLPSLPLGMEVGHEASLQDPAN